MVLVVGWNRRAAPRGALLHAPPTGRCERGFSPPYRSPTSDFHLRTTYPPVMRLFLRAVALLAAGLLALAFVLPRRVEVRREALVAAPAAAVIAALAQLPSGPAWAAWTPALEGRLRTTSLGEAGVWFEVGGARRRLAAIQVFSTPQGTRVVWTDVEHYGIDPIGQLLGGFMRDERVGEELERSLSGLRASVE